MLFSSQQREQQQDPSSAAATAALERTKRHLEKLQQQQQAQQQSRNKNGFSSSASAAELLEDEDTIILDPIGEEREQLYQEYIQQPANTLKVLLKQRNLVAKGRKPDLVQRLVEDDLKAKYGMPKIPVLPNSDDDDDDEELDVKNVTPPPMITKFAGLTLSSTASDAMSRAGFVQPTSIQQIAIPKIYGNKQASCILHAATGSGKTIAYLLPFTERLWQQHDDEPNNTAMILTPTRELAAQVAGIATVLSPPGTVRLVTSPSNLMMASKDETTMPRIYVGSAKTIYQSLYGTANEKLPVAPTPKPLAMYLLKHIQYLVLDEVDRLLFQASQRQSSTRNKKQTSKKHERPAAILTAAGTRLTLGKNVVVAVSATVGRPLKRELARCMGLPPKQCPPVLRAADEDNAVTAETKVHENSAHRSGLTTPTTTGRAVTIPDTVQHFYVVSSTNNSGKGSRTSSDRDGPSTPGKILTTIYQLIQKLDSSEKKILLVLTRNFGIHTHNTIGALTHFKCQYEPISLLDALEATDDDVDDINSTLIQVHRQVSGASGVGESSNQNDSNSSSSTGYLLVTGEDTIRGLHLDNLDMVLIAGRPMGPDEYTHISGRTGRAGRTGQAITVVGDPRDAAKLVSWENMLRIQFQKWDC